MPVICVFAKPFLRIVNGDPSKDIRLLMDADRNIDVLMKDGKIYKNTLH